MRVCRNRFALAAGLAAVLGLVAGSAVAQDVTLKVHHFLPPKAVAHAQFMQPWADKVMEDSGGRIKIDIFPAMQLGGKPPQLFDQVRDGVVDVVWTVAGYTAGRFPTIEVFELPFVPGTAEATSQAAHEFYELHAKEEFAEVHPLMIHVHAPGSFHMKDKPVQSLADLKDAKIRAPTRVINSALKMLGATPVGMPVPAVPEAISKGVVDGAMLPYEVTLPLRVHEMTDTHTDVGGDRGLYTAVFLFAMNKAKYEGLPADLKQVIDDNSGLALAQRIGRVWDEAEAPGREKAQALGDTFYIIVGDELQAWKSATRPVIDGWVASMNDAGKDGEALLKSARDLVDKYSR
ncbi:MAG: TRAP transporter substrate-binding protein [Alphaproteobacteria bacterium]|nr:TRAP transporter substrate-binding protein [Alphaproteobacteria bacterium]